ncbi:hypothetical protein M9458_003710, partial [Cirrhinus mrigala]
GEDQALSSAEREAGSISAAGTGLFLWQRPDGFTQGLQPHVQPSSQPGSGQSQREAEGAGCQ